MSKVTATPSIARVTVAIVVLASALAASPGQGRAADYPIKPIKFVVPFPPGGSTDLVARLVSKSLTEALPTSVFVENRAGGSGIIATEYVARENRDGYTLLLGNTGILAINPNLYRKLKYDVDRDFSPVTLMTRVPNLLVVHPSVPAHSVRELVQLTQRTKQRLNYGSPGSGSLQHLAMELFKTYAKVDFEHIPYRGAGPALIDLIGGHLDLMVATMPSAMPHIRSKRLRPLAIGDADRSAIMPDLPTIAESGYPGYEAYSWHGVLVPAGTDAAVIRRLNRAIVSVLRQPEVRNTLVQKSGFDVVGSSVEDFAELIRDERTKYAKAVKAAHLKVD